MGQASRCVFWTWRSADGEQLLLARRKKGVSGRVLLGPSRSRPMPPPSAWLRNGANALLGFCNMYVLDSGLHQGRGCVPPIARPLARCELTLCLVLSNQFKNNDPESLDKVLAFSPPHASGASVFLSNVFLCHSFNCVSSLRPIPSVPPSSSPPSPLLPSTSHRSLVPSLPFLCLPLTPAPPRIASLHSRAPSVSLSMPPAHLPSHCDPHDVRGATVLVGTRRFRTFSLWGAPVVPTAVSAYFPRERRVLRVVPTKFPVLWGKVKKSLSESIEEFCSATPLLGGVVLTNRWEHHFYGRRGGGGVHHYAGTTFL